MLKQNRPKKRERLAKVGISGRIPIMILVHILCLFLHLVIGDQIKFAEKISTRSTAAKGILLCGNTSANDVKVRLFRKASDGMQNIYQLFLINL
ncbi:unnamed protein product [Brugia timori]|uniref:Transmembrane protein n=1 Tax=Brugia timori TaxID=42155 RepID=A0A0R3R3I4_9BILA|nr:unnamed protein product [Brugia timori]